MKNEIHILYTIIQCQNQNCSLIDFYKCQSTAMNSINVLSDVVPLPSIGRREARGDMCTDVH